VKKKTRPGIGKPVEKRSSRGRRDEGSTSTAFDFDGNLEKYKVKAQDFLSDKFETEPLIWCR
jgi:hypothetical protein